MNSLKSGLCLEISISYCCGTSTEFENSTTLIKTCDAWGACMWCMRCKHVMHEVHAWIYKVFEARSCESQWSSSICAAMVTKIPSKVFFQVEIDSMITYSDSNWPTMWCTSNSRKIFPVAWCVQNNIQLTLPPGMQFLNTAHLISMFVFLWLKHSWLCHLIFYTLTSGCIFSILFSIHFLRNWRGESV